MPPSVPKATGKKVLRNFIILYEIEAFQSNWYSNLYEISRIEAYEMDLYYS